MLDTRKCLKKGTVLRLDKEYVIQEEIGRGASCLVYDGYYIDSGRHLVRIKECYPYDIDADRDAGGAIIPAKSWEKQFEAAKQIFSDAYRRNNEFRNKEGLINATVDSRWKHKKNNTIYSIISYIEGMDYRKFSESCLKNIFIRMKRLCKIIEDYHKDGYLHLDIKPENILIPSDTKEQVVLFDFDSLLEIKNLEGENEVRISCSKGFSAPELVQGDRKKIGTVTDIYSIGAVIFYKIFGKTPGVWDRTWNAAYDFSTIFFPDERYQPKLFQKLTEFFHKTLSAAVLRYQNMKEVIAALEELEKISDVEGVILLNNFSYSFSQFVGRREELLQIQNKLKETDIVFLSGMGGIGKTELAKNFANKYRNQFNRIVFLRFTNSIMETVCSDELVIAGCEVEKQESLSDFYARKIASLKQSVDKNDLIILDNFDNKNNGDAIEEDEQFNDMLNCGCRLLITTRENFWREYDYAQIDIGPLKNDFEYKDLFQKNNSKEYSDREWESIDQLFLLFENHTMTIALLAKYLLHTEQMPSELLCQIEKRNGLVNAVNPVRHNKDDMRRERQMYSHLQILFNLSGFKEMETEIMRSLSLLGPVRIRKSIFVQYFKACSSMEEHLENLLKHGWVEEDVKTGKISLHQIILDLAYNTLKPTAENCPHMIRSMISYFREKEECGVYRENREKMAEYFIDRIGGSDYLLAELYYEYCRNIKYEEQTLKDALQICQETDSFESDILTVKLHQLEIRALIKKKEWIELEEDQMESALNDVYCEVFQLERNIFANLRNAVLRKNKIPQNRNQIILPEITDIENKKVSFFQDLKRRKEETEKVSGDIFESYIEKGYMIAPYVNDTLVRLFLKTADAVETLGNRICEECFLMEEPYFSGLGSIYHDAKQIYLYTCKLAEQKFISYEVKEDVYKKIIEFFAEDDFMYSFRCAHVGDESKRALYSEKLHDVRAVLTGGNEMFNSSEVSYAEAAWQAGQNGRYEDALALYQRALEKNQIFPEDFFREMSDAYISLYEYEKAETLLMDALRGHKTEGTDICAILEKIVEIYELQKNIKGVIEYCNRIIQNQKNLAEEGDLKAIARVLVFSIKKAKWEGGGRIHLEEREYLEWNKYFRILNTCGTLDHILVSAYCEYAKYCWETDQPGQVVELLFSAAEKYLGACDYSSAEKVYHCITGDSRFKETRKELYIKSILGEAAILGGYTGGAKTALELCRYAEELIKEETTDREYIEAALKKVQANIYHYSEDYYDYEKYRNKLRQCNYYLLTERKVQQQINNKSAFEEWKEAADNYIDFADTEMVERCLQRMEKEAEKEKKMSCFLIYYSTCCTWDKKSHAMDKLSVHIKELFSRLNEYIYCNEETVDQTICLRVLEVIGSNALECKAYDIALCASLFSVFIILDTQWMSKPEVLEDLLEKEFFAKDYVCRADKFFPDRIEADKVDHITQLIEKLLVGIEGNMELKELYVKLRGIEKRYRTTQVEFKR